MIDKKYVELIHREIDGLSSSKERTELKAYLEKNPQAKTLYKELRAVSEKLGGVDTVEPPAHLITAIMNSLPKHRYARTSKHSLLHKLKSIFNMQPRFQLVLAFSSGLAAGLILFMLFNTNPDQLAAPDPADLYGTLAFRDFSEKIPVVKQYALQLEQVQGSVALKASKELVFVEMDLRAQPGIEIFLAFQKPGISFQGFAGLDEIQGASLRIEERGLKFYPHLATKTMFLFRKTTAKSEPFKMRITRAGNVLYEKELAIPKVVE
ncbi:MAG: anti-sigma factor family protein [bacterium]